MNEIRFPAVTPTIEKTLFILGITIAEKIQRNRSKSINKFLIIGFRSSFGSISSTSSLSTLSLLIDYSYLNSDSSSN